MRIDNNMGQKVLIERSKSDEMLLKSPQNTKKFVERIQPIRRVD
jgi:hypothetical protein